MLLLFLLHLIILLSVQPAFITSIEFSFEQAVAPTTDAPESELPTTPAPATLPPPFRHTYTLYKENRWVDDPKHQSTFDPQTEITYIILEKTYELFALHPDGRLENLGRLVTEDKLKLFLEVIAGGEKLLLWASGLGPVYEFDLATKQFTRIDRSLLNMYMFGHAAAVDDQNVLHAVGGYGYWETRNRFLFYDRKTMGWELVPVGEVKPLPFNGGTMVYLPQKREFLLVSFVKDVSRKVLQVLTYDKSTNEWLKQGFHQLNDATPTSIESDASVSNHRIDPEAGLLYLWNGLFYDINENAFLLQPRDRTSERHIINYTWNAFYSEKRKGWVRVGFLNTQSEVSMVYETYEPKDLMTVSSRILLPTRFEDQDGNVLFSYDPVRTLSWIAGVMMIVIFVGGTYIATRPKPMNDSKRLKLTVKMDNDGPERVTVGDRLLPLEDATMRQMVILLTELKTNNVETIPLTELDAKLFPRQANSTVTSKSRNRLIDYFNDQMGRTILTLERSSFDRRFRILNVDLDSVEVITKGGEQTV